MPHEKHNLWTQGHKNKFTIITKEIDLKQLNLRSLSDNEMNAIDGGEVILQNPKGYASNVAKGEKVIYEKVLSLINNIAGFLNL